MPSDEQWEDIKGKDEDVAKFAEIYNDSSVFTVYSCLYMAIHRTNLRLAPAGKELAQHYHNSKQTGTNCMRMLHRNTSILVNGLKKLDQRLAETEKFIELQKRSVDLDQDVQFC